MTVDDARRIAGQLVGELRRSADPTRPLRHVLVCRGHLADRDDAAGPGPVGRLPDRYDPRRPECRWSIPPDLYKSDYFDAYNEIDSTYDDGVIRWSHWLFRRADDCNSARSFHDTAYRAAEALRVLLPDPAGADLPAAPRRRGDLRGWLIRLAYELAWADRMPFRAPWRVVTRCPGIAYRPPGWDGRPRWPIPGPPWPGLDFTPSWCYAVLDRDVRSCVADTIELVIEDTRYIPQKEAAERLVSSGNAPNVAAAQTSLSRLVARGDIRSRRPDRTIAGSPRTRVLISLRDLDRFIRGESR